METETKFIERRRTARVAGTVGIDNDPLVAQIRREWQDTQDVMRRMREYRAAEAQKTTTEEI